jgi:hypothetical protein
MVTVVWCPRCQKWEVGDFVSENKNLCVVCSSDLSEKLVSVRSGLLVNACLEIQEIDRSLASKIMMYLSPRPITQIRFDALVSLFLALGSGKTSAQVSEFIEAFLNNGRA